MNKKIIIIIILACFLLSYRGHTKDTTKFRFAVMGCMHFGICGPEDYKLAVEKIKQYKPDFVLFLGGMVDAVGEKPIESLWEEFNRITAKLGVPVYDIPSDLSKSCGLTHRDAPKNRVALLEKYFRDKYPRRYYSFEHKNNLFICLDEIKKDEYFKGEEQILFLQETLADVSQYNNVFVAIHRSPWMGSEREWSRDIHPIFKDKVKYVFGAHLHFLDTKKIGNVTYITTGCPPCQQKSPFKLTFFHFLIVYVDEKEASVKVVPLKPFPIETVESYGEKTEEVLKFLRGAREPKPVKLHMLSVPERDAVLHPERIIKTLNIKPGMSILDIGAGAGFFSFRFAETLKGTGEVFATEVDPGMVEYIKEKMEEYKYKNIFPVLVKSEGVDPFYKQRSFDIIFLGSVYQYLFHPEDYFRELRPSLKKTGRLYILHFRNVSDFSEFEFADFKNVMRVLISYGEGYPVFKRLGGDTQYFINNWHGGNDVPFKIRKKIVEEFNKIISDRFFFDDLMDYYAPKGVAIEWGKRLRSILYPNDFRLAKWLIVHLDEDGVFDESRKKISDLDKRRLGRLNRILLTGIFQSERLYGLKGDPIVYVEKNSIIAELKSVGYQFVGEHDFLPQHYLLEFKRTY